MSLRDLPDRARSEGIRAIQGFVDGVRDLIASNSGSDLYVVRGVSERRSDDPVWLSRTDPDAEETPAVVDRDVARSLERLAETVDGLAAQLDAHHTERAEQLDAIEYLLREVVLGGASNRAVVWGGVIEPNGALAVEREISLVPDGLLLEIDTAVEVRSRFHDHWICGFAVAEVIDGGPGASRYRLTRRSDGIPLPLLFDACDVRAAASVAERQPAAD
jgi:hypothetical protein